MNMELIDLQDTDFELVKSIYDYYIVNTTATFHTELISIEELKSVILIHHPRYKSFLITLDGKVCGYCYLSQYKKRQAYDRTAEVSIYLEPSFIGKGIGRKVLEMMEKIAIDNGISVLIGIISEENKTSISLFEKCGYDKCAHFREVGEKFGRLLDVVAYQKKC
jgi:L-amino acid N-acyltransferase YncA